MWVWVRAVTDLRVLQVGGGERPDQLIIQPSILLNYLYNWDFGKQKTVATLCSAPWPEQVNGAMLCESWHQHTGVSLFSPLLQYVPVRLKRGKKCENNPNAFAQSNWHHIQFQSWNKRFIANHLVFGSTVYWYVWYVSRYYSIYCYILQYCKHVDKLFHRTVLLFFVYASDLCLTSSCLS